MMMNEFATRRGYDDRYENLDGWTRQGRGYDGGPRRGLGGESMREPSWMRDYGWAREPAWFGRDPSLGRQDSAYEPMVRVIELVAESPHSWEDATRRAIAEASQSVRGIRSIYIKDMQAVVDEDQVLGFRVHAKIAFTLDGAGRRR